MRLSGKVAFIAGAGGRQGTAVPILFAKEGARVFCAGRNEADLRRIVERIRAFGGEAELAVGDLSETEFVTAAVEQAVRAYGRIDVLYNNTGAYLAGEKPPHKTLDDDWDTLLSVDLRSHFLSARAVLPGMIERRSGAIINVAAARTARLGGNVGYAAAKGGIIAMTENLARRYRSVGIRVNSIAPTNISASVSPLDPGLPDGRLDRPGTPEDVAFAALYLASDEAAWVTGITLTVDGGG